MGVDDGSPTYNPPPTPPPGPSGVPPIDPMHGATYPDSSGDLGPGGMQWPATILNDPGPEWRLYPDGFFHRIDDWNEVIKATEGPPIPWVQGGDNSEYYASQMQDPWSWQNNITNRLEYLLMGIADMYGEDRESYLYNLRVWTPDLYSYLESSFITPAMNAGEYDANGRTFWQANLTGQGLLYRAALVWMQARDPRIQMGAEAMYRNRTSGGPRSGAAGPQYDIDEITANVTDYWRAYLREEPTDPRGIARSFVAGWLANPALDFKTFLVNKMKTTDRWDTMYRFKPEGLDELEYQAPYIQAAQSLLRPDEAIEVGVGGMRLGADQASFGARLTHHATVQKSAPFINNLEQRLESLGGVLR